MRHATPKSMKVLDRRFRIKEVPDLKIAMTHLHPNDYTPPEEVKDGTWVHEDEFINVLGLTDFDAQTIAIDTIPAFESQQTTFLHEALHAMMSVAGMRDALTQEAEERVCKRLAPIMRLWLKENPHVYAYLTGRNIY